MADKIDGIRQAGIPVAQKRSDATAARGKAEGEEMSRTTPVRGDRVELTDSARRVQALEEKLAALPEVDEARVTKWRARLEEGGYQIDADRIAQRLLAAEKKLS